MNLIYRFIALGLVFLASTANAADHYFLLFCHDSQPKKPGESHTYAVFTQVEGRDITDTCVINWGPVGEYRLGDGKVPGVNRPYEETLKESKSEGKQIYMWGPYQISDEFYQDAVRQKQKLDSGAMLYQVTDRVTAFDLVDAGGKPAINCIHAVSDIAGNLVTGGKYGERVGDVVISHFKQKGLLLGESEFYVWIPEKLGVTEYLPTRR